MADEKVRNSKKHMNAPKGEKWRFTCIDLDCDRESSLETAKSNVDIRNQKFLEGIGFQRDAKGLVIKADSNTVESEIINGKKLVHKRVAMDGNILYEDKEMAIASER